MSCLRNEKNEINLSCLLRYHGIFNHFVEFSVCKMNPGVLRILSFNPCSVSFLYKMRKLSYGCNKFLKEFDRQWIIIYREGHTLDVLIDLIFYFPQNWHTFVFLSFVVSFSFCLDDEKIWVQSAVYLIFYNQSDSCIYQNLLPSTIMFSGGVYLVIIGLWANTEQGNE